MIRIFLFGVCDCKTSSQDRGLKVFYSLLYHVLRVRSRSMTGPIVLIGGELAWHGWIEAG